MFIRDTPSLTFVHTSCVAWKLVCEHKPLNIVRFDCVDVDQYVNLVHRSVECEM